MFSLCNVPGVVGEPWWLLGSRSHLAALAGTRKKGRGRSPRLFARRHPLGPEGVRAPPAPGGGGAAGAAGSEGRAVTAAPSWRGGIGAKPLPLEPALAPRAILLPTIGLERVLPPRGVSFPAVAASSRRFASFSPVAQVLPPDLGGWRQNLNHFLPGAAQ